MNEKQKIHFLHIGKTGGTAIKYSLQNDLNTGKYEIILHDHNYALMDVPIGEKVCFFTRDPISRFSSGFYSRQRCGRPRYNVPWNKDEKKAFEYFESSNDLAMALSSMNFITRRRGTDAMRDIIHVNSSYWDWFCEMKYFKSRIDDIFFIGRQEYLSEDFEILKYKLGLLNISLPQDSINMHKNPESINSKNSRKAIKNLKKWYKNDFEFMDVCENITYNQVR